MVNQHKKTMYTSCKKLREGSGGKIPSLSYVVIRKSLYEENPCAAWLFGCGYAAMKKHHSSNVRCKLLHISWSGWMRLSGLSESTVTRTVRWLKLEKYMHVAHRTSNKYNHECAYSFEEFHNDTLTIVDPLAAIHLRKKYPRAWLNLTVLLFRMFEYSIMEYGVCNVGSEKLAKDMGINEVVVRRLIAILIKERLICYLGISEDDNTRNCSIYAVPSVYVRGKNRWFVEPRKDTTVTIYKRAKPKLDVTAEELKQVKDLLLEIREDVKVIRELNQPYIVLPDVEEQPEPSNIERKDSESE